MNAPFQLINATFQLTDAFFLTIFSAMDYLNKIATAPIAVTIKIKRL